MLWPELDSQQLSLWNPIPIGIDELGEVVTISLPERNMLLGGEPGAGKSVGLSMLVAAAALDSSCQLFLLDGKQVELACWSRCAVGSAGPSIQDAIDVLRSVQTEMDARYERLLTAGKRKVAPNDGINLQMIVCDELAYYLSIGDRKANQEFSTLCRDIVARGRAAGIIFIGATQKPSHDVIPTSLRDLFAFRWALRCTTPQASDTILGQGWASEGYSAKDVDPAHKGVGYLVAEGGLPRRMKSYYLSDEHLDVLGKRAQALRTTSPTPTKGETRAA
jgi:DNA segregation ATPase FtsK/SpoIIIE-like protein